MGLRRLDDKLPLEGVVHRDLAVVLHIVGSEKTLQLYQRWGKSPERFIKFVIAQSHPDKRTSATGVLCSADSFTSVRAALQRIKAVLGTSRWHLLPQYVQRHPSLMFPAPQSDEDATCNTGPRAARDTAPSGFNTRQSDESNCEATADDFHDTMHEPHPPRQTPAPSPPPTVDATAPPSTQDPESRSRRPRRAACREAEEKIKSWTRGSRERQEVDVVGLVDSDSDEPAAISANLAQSRKRRSRGLSKKDRGLSSSGPKRRKEAAHKDENGYLTRIITSTKVTDPKVAFENAVHNILEKLQFREPTKAWHFVKPGTGKAPVVQGTARARIDVPFHHNKWLSGKNPHGLEKEFNATWLSLHPLLSKEDIPRILDAVNARVPTEKTVRGLNSLPRLSPTFFD